MCEKLDNDLLEVVLAKQRQKNETISTIKWGNKFVPICKISNSAFDDTEVQETILSVVQVELNYLDRSQLRYKAEIFYPYIHILKKWMENLISKILKLIKVFVLFLNSRFWNYVAKTGKWYNKLYH